jgi:hypothetical protein
MLRASMYILMVTAIASFGAQGSGIYFDAHVSRGEQNGDKLYQFSGPAFGAIVGDSIRYIANGREATGANNYGSDYQAFFQYVVQYSFLAGYEKSLNTFLSVRGAIGYQKALLDAHASTITDSAEVPFITAKIDRHWISIPIDFKVTLPLGRSGLYCAAGPKASILLSSKYTDSLTNTTEDLSGFTPRLNVGIGLRLGAEFPIAKAGFLFIESGYHIGLLNTSPITSSTTQEGEISLFGMGFRLNLP